MNNGDCPLQPGLRLDFSTPDQFVGLKSKFGSKVYADRTASYFADVVRPTTRNPSMLRRPGCTFTLSTSH